LDSLKQHHRLFIIEGILFVILGMLAIAIPVIFTFGVELLFGAFLIVGGIFQEYRAYNLWKKPGFYMSLLTGILSLILGVVFIANPLNGVLTLTIMLMLYFFISGLFKIIMAFEMRSMAGWGWILTSGIIGIIMGAIIYSGWPGTALWVIGLLLGIDMLFFGISMLTLSSAIGPKKL
jgi:uncharacterized membrane protein HdeD (DUF308 family)